MLYGRLPIPKMTSQPASQTAEEQRRPQEPDQCWVLPGKVPHTHSQALGTFPQYISTSVIFRSQLKVGGQAGHSGKEQSESKRTCFHCSLYKKILCSWQDIEFAMQLPPLRSDPEF